MEQGIREINENVRKESSFIQELKKEISKVIVGQHEVIDRVLIGLMGDGHILIEGVPGLAKTLLIKTLSECIQAKFRRLQFTPDLLPADLLGTMIYNPKLSEFAVKKGPIFANIILADEINRAPAKVQSALLEAMQEHQVTIGENSYKLEEPFMVLATQNPIEQEGTYPLPEAQVDRFMLKIKITYPERDEEAVILEKMSGAENSPLSKIISPEDINRVRNVVKTVYMDEKVRNYILDVVFATRYPAKYKLEELNNSIAYGASPRASIYLSTAARCMAFINGRGFVTPDDVKSIAYDVLRHRVILSYEAEAEELSSEDIITQILDTVEVP